eukprot:CAMPEP_0117617286 /NCGR_PEP_ID=MMETSP0784-20121206/85516_1 /TAXON_ID=39447 /ORGANISM="" /LENGTH=92 /DNA_ID=CAMNT_0005421127 /DNA_START=958 /DNA_END=1233 /DNA_ORIENTATION=+
MSPLEQAMSKSSRTLQDSASLEPNMNSAVNSCFAKKRSTRKGRVGLATNGSSRPWAVAVSPPFLTASGKLGAASSPSSIRRACEAFFARCRL